MYYLFSFRSRNQSMRFFEMLQRNNVSAKIISTPRSVSVGCGLSVQVAPSYIFSAKQIFSYSSFDAFLGLFYCDGNSVTRV